MKKLLSIIMFVVIAVSMLTTNVYATSFYDATTVSVSDNELHMEAGNYGSLSGYNFSITDIRGGASTFNGADGKYAIVVLGGIGSCSYTSTVLGYLDGLLENMDKSQINVYAIDIRSNTDATIRNALSLESISSDIFVISERNGSECSGILQLGLQMNGGQGFTMPMVLFKDKSGTVYDFTTGMVGVNELVTIMEEGGMQVNYDASMQKLNLTGTATYSYAYQVLDLVNAERAKEGAPALTMDADLMEAAMNRSAEIAIYFSHTRPNGLMCFSISNKLNGENIASGYRTPQDVMVGWMNSSGHRANILNASYTTIGIGCFKVDGVCYWTQCFGVNAATTTTKPADVQKTYAIMANSTIQPTFYGTSSTLTVGDTKQLVVYVDGTPIDASTYTWSSNSAAATVDSNGKVTAKSAGTATITATNRNLMSKKLTYNIIVQKKTSSGSGSTGGSTSGGNTSGGNASGGNTSAGGTQNAPAMTQIESFVERMYVVALNRDAESAGLEDWSNRLAQQQIDGAGIAQGFIGSTEFKNRNLDDFDYICTLYETFFNRAPDIDGLNNWYWFLVQGGSRQDVLSGFVNSQEFSNLCDNYGIARGTMQPNGTSIYRPGVRNYVLRMYTKALNRDGETVGVEDWTNRINTGTMSAENVAKSFFSSQEFINRNLSNSAYVETLYQTFMDRPSDAGGKQYWIDKLNSGMSREQVLEGFSRSAEFSEIMSRYGL